jgi:hypothetical protein
MKTLSPAASVRSVGRIRWWTPLIAIVCISCLPLFNAQADEHNHDQKAGSAHQSAAHGGGASRSATTHRGGYHATGGNRTVSSHHAVSRNVSSHHVASVSSHHVAGTHRSASSHHEATVSRTASSHQGGSHRNGSTTAVASHQARPHETTVIKTASANQKNSELKNISPELKRGASANTRTSLYSRNTGSSRQTHPTRTLARATTAYNHSLTRSSVQGLMNRRLTEISNRQWTTHGAVFSSRSDPKAGYWFHHGGYWWRCNFWGARSYCDHLIIVGQPAGLCWAWYDDICWGNIVIGMPFGLIPYYYPTPVYTEDTDYDGEPATVYYYTTDDGQYKQITVVDGDVVDVEIVDHIA